MSKAKGDKTRSQNPRRLALSLPPRRRSLNRSFPSFRSRRVRWERKTSVPGIIPLGRGSDDAGEREWTKVIFRPVEDEAGPTT